MDDVFRALVGIRWAFPRNGRVRRWLKRSVIEHGVVKEKE